MSDEDVEKEKSEELQEVVPVDKSVSNDEPKPLVVEEGEALEPDVTESDSAEANNASVDGTDSAEAQQFAETQVIPSVVPDQPEVHVQNESSVSPKKARPGWMKFAVIGVVAVIVAAVLSVLFIHDWADATCTEPQVCRICGATQGEPLGHDWEPATCLKPETCSRCGETQGEALGHKMGEWVVEREATCTVEGIRSRECERCGYCVKDIIDTLDHQPGEWEVESEPTLDSYGDVVPGRRVQHCTACGWEIASEEITLSDEEIAEMYQSSCKSLTYEQVARDPDTYEGTRARFTGEVIQVLQDGNSYTLRVDITQTSWGYTDTIMVAYDAPEGASRILEDDVVTLYGVMMGMYTYESVMGASITVPLMYAEYVVM